MASILPQFINEATPGTVGIWGLIAIVSVALIKAWPVLSLQAANAREKLRAEGRTDLSDCRKEIAALRAELDIEREAREASEKKLSEEHHKLELKLLGAISGYRILHADLSARQPDAPALRQAEAVLSAAFTLSPSTDAPIIMPEGLE